MVGHTGDFNAAIKAVEAVDTCLGEIIECAKKHDYAFIITSDHGNCEAMQDEKEICLPITLLLMFLFLCKQREFQRLKIIWGLAISLQACLKF